MKFGATHIKTAFWISIVLSLVSLSIALSASEYRESVTQNYTTLKEERKAIESQRVSLRESLNILSDLSDDYTALPNNLSVEASRATIIAFLRKLSAQVDSQDLDFQFYNRTVLPSGFSSDTSPDHIAVDSLLLSGQIKHMGDLYKIINYMSDSIKHYEIRGCDVKRIVESNTVSVMSNKKSLKISCMISWYSLSTSNI